MTLRTLPTALLLAALSALALPATGLAQIPGGDPNAAFDRRDAVRAEVRARALREVSEELTEWADAWLEDDVGELMDRYADQARVRGLPFGFASGKDALEGKFEAYLEDVGDIRLNMREFNASGRLAYGVASYAYHAVGEDGSGSMQQGTVMMAFLKEDGWKILSQLFVLDTEAGSGGGSGGRG